jgi:hypothetical protein
MSPNGTVPLSGWPLRGGRGIKKYMKLLKTEEKIILKTLWCMLSEDFQSVIICL